MEIIIKTIGSYKFVSVKNGDTTVDLGLMDDDKCEILAQVLLGAVCKLTDNEYVVKEEE